jgi:Arylsulfotransferase (ASST).
MIGKTMKLKVFLPGVAACLCLAAGCGGTSKDPAEPMLAAGQVTATNNPQVALYAMTLPMAGSMSVEFGTDTNYGLKTWAQSTDTAGGKVSVFVAGMKASTTYHMRAVVKFANGTTESDVDHVFTTGAMQANMKLNVTTTTAAGMTPQGGVELLNALSGTPTGVVVTDLAGNTLWTYANTSSVAQNYINGVKMMANGNLLMAIGMGIPFSAVPAETVNEIREVNLAGDAVRRLTVSDLNAALALASCAECHVTVATFHHDVEPLPNGHWLLLAAAAVPLSGTSTPALTNAPAATVLGDVVVDVDANMKPVWVWSVFNHLDPNRHPFGVTDWTHGNAVVYSKDDGNLLVSLRHQNWVLKVRYMDGVGDGSVLWRLGAGGNFALQGGNDPMDWMYAQHLPAFFSTNTSGVFSLGAMDNGNNRPLAGGAICGVAEAAGCYTAIPVWRIDESAKTATVTFRQVLPGNEYSFFGGNVQQLANGHVEYDLCGVGLTTPNSQVFEVTQDASMQTVWSMQVTGTYLYRASRMGSMYPGVQW